MEEFRFRRSWTDEKSVQHYKSSDKTKTMCGKDIPELRKVVQTSADGLTYHVRILDPIRVGGKSTCEICQKANPPYESIKVKSK